jgi:hypothetical protein
MEVASGSKVSAPNALRRSPDRRIRRKSPCEDFGFAAKTYQEWLTRPFFPSPQIPSGSQARGSGPIQDSRWESNATVYAILLRSEWHSVENTRVTPKFGSPDFGVMLHSQSEGHL